MLKKFYEKNKIVILETVAVFLIVIINSFIFGGHYRTLFVDMGKELLIPLSILNGEVIYKSILTVDFPLPYLINAFGMLILGKNISTLYVLGTINCCIFLSVFYFLCHLFLNRMLSWSIFLATLYGCVCFDGITNYLFGHSFGMTYGLTAYLICVFCAVKFLKTKNINFVYWSAFFAGVSVSLKAEFFPVVFIPFILFSYQKPERKEIFKSILLLLSVPVLSLVFLFAQGLTISELISSVKFMFAFTNTDAMTYFYKDIGAVPNFDLVKFFRYILYFGEFVISCLLIYAGFHFCFVKKSMYPVWIGFIGVLLFFAFTAEPYCHFVFFPYILLIFFIINYKNIIKDGSLYVLSFALLGLLIRVWADFKTNFYGIYSFPFVLLFFSVLIVENCRKLKIFSKIKPEYIVTMLILCYSTYYFLSDVKAVTINNFPVSTNYGTIFVPENVQKDVNGLIKYLKENTSESDKIVVLPEGHMINYLCGRKSDMRLHMLDRLYYEALGEEKSLNLLKDADYNYIIIAKGYGLDNFGKPFLYTEENPVADYIKNDYETVKIFGNQNEYIEVKYNR